MRRFACSVVVALAVSACGAACRTDEPRRGDDAGPPATPSAPTTPPSTTTLAGPSDAGVVPTAGRGGMLGEVPGDVPVVSELADAGHASDQVASPPDGSSAVGSGSPGRPPPVKVDPIQVTIFNRVLARTKARDLHPGQVQELAAQLTKQKVERARRTAGTFWLIQFAPTTPPRGKAEQQQLIEQLKAGGDFEFVEADQIMTVK
jgi:hypothetical protein